MKHFYLKHIFLCLCLFAGINAFAYDAQINGIYYNFSGNEATVTFGDYLGNNYSGTVVIYSSVTDDSSGKTYSVTGIDDRAFYRCSDLTSVTIPSSVTSIGKDAFAYCSSLESITIPDNVTSIGDNAFHFCESLKSIDIPNSVTSIGKYAFYSCSSLESITIPDNVTSIEEYTFWACVNLTSITIPNKVASIGKDAFANCHNLISVTIPESVTSINESAFYVCNRVTSVYITNLTAWCNIQFKDNDSNPFNNIEYVNSPLHHLYLNGEEIKDLVIPENVTSIGSSAFYGCTSLNSITIPNSVTSIGKDAFTGCKGLSSIIVEEGNLNYNSHDNANAIIETASKKLITGCKNTIIPNDVTCIGNNAFYCCSSLTSIIIPESVKSIDSGAFSYCSSLTSINIPDSVTSIGYSAFRYCSSLNPVTIGKGVTIINGSAFEYCSSLTSINIPDSVTSIGEYAFLGCTNLTTIIIGSGIKSIGFRVFAACSSITDVWCYAEDAPYIDSQAFNNSPKGKLHVPIGYVVTYKVNTPWDIYSIAAIIDEDSSSPIPAGTLMWIDLKRTFAEGWNTICLPFTIENIEGSFGTGAKAYEFNGFTNGELSFSPVTSLTASKPYVIYMPATITDYIKLGESGSYIYINYTEGSYFSQNDAYFRGTFAPVAAGGWTKNNSTNDIYGVTPDGHIRKAGADASIKGLRAYFEIPAGTEVKGFVFEDGATGIKTLSNSPLKGENIYNLAGQRLNKAQKGINIVNGKKVLY